jgi:hypothetical protein
LRKNCIQIILNNTYLNKAAYKTLILCPFFGSLKYCLDHIVPVLIARERFEDGEVLLEEFEDKDLRLRASVALDGALNHVRGDLLRAIVQKVVA